MVEIVRGDHKTKVTMGAYENTFKPLGYTLVKGKLPKISEEPVKVDTIKAEPVKVGVTKFETAKNTEIKGKNKKQED